MKFEYVLPVTFLLSGYLIYKKFYAIDFKELFNDGQQKDFLGALLLFNPEHSVDSFRGGLEKEIDDIDWESVSG